MRTKLLLMVAVTSIAFNLGACSSDEKPTISVLQPSVIPTVAVPTSEPSSTPTVAAPTSEPSPTPTEEPRVSCPENEVVAYLDELDLLLEEFDDTVTLASSTTRIGLAPVIQQMQAQRRSARRLERPECANYLQDLVIVAMESKVDAFISFLSKDSDTVVARKNNASDQVRAAVDAEIVKFRNDPLRAYEASEVTAASLAEDLDRQESFVLPNGWVNIEIPDSNGLILSLPGSWTFETTGDHGEDLDLANGDGTLKVAIRVLDDGVSSNFGSDRARLFSLQTTLETIGWDFYSERSAEIGLYALNRGYVVRFAGRYSQSSDIEDHLWAAIVTPNGLEVLSMASTERDDFAQIDLLTLEEVFGSIRSPE